MPRRLILANAVMLALAGLFAFELYGALSGARPLPAPPAPRLAQPGAGEAGVPAQASAARSDPRPLYSVIATKNLFNPSRTEVAAAAPGTPAVARPLLHGVVVNDGKSRAYLEDPASKKVFGYAVGDQVGGGRLETITDDRVVITRPEGAIEVMLRDPAKPRPAAPTAPPSPRAAPPGTGASTPQILRPPPAPGQPAMPPAIVPRPETSQAPPRTPQSLPPDFLRRRGVPTAPGSAAGASGG